MSDPFILVTGLADDSPLHEFGIKPGDAIMTVDGKDFDTIGEFAALTKENKDMVWQMFHVPSTPGYLEDDDAGYDILETYKQRVKNGILMRVGHEVKVRDAWQHAHENDLEHPERFVPDLAIDKMRTLDSLLGFLVLQTMGRKEEDNGVAPIICSIVTAFEENGSVPNCSRENLGHYAKPTPQEWLETKMAEWRQRRGEWATGGKGKKAGGRPGKVFLEQYAKFAELYPDAYGSEIGNHNNELQEGTGHVEVADSTSDSAVDNAAQNAAENVEEVATSAASEWVQYYDETSQAYYYENSASGETSWDEPENFVPYAEYEQ